MFDAAYVNEWALLVPGRCGGVRVTVEQGVLDITRIVPLYTAVAAGVGEVGLYAWIVVIGWTAAQTRQCTGWTTGSRRFDEWTAIALRFSVVQWLGFGAATGGSGRLNQRGGEHVFGLERVAGIPSEHRMELLPRIRRPQLYRGTARSTRACLTATGRQLRLGERSTAAVRSVEMEEQDDLHDVMGEGGHAVFPRRPWRCTCCRFGGGREGHQGLHQARGKTMSSRENRGISDAKVVSIEAATPCCNSARSRKEKLCVGVEEEQCFCAWRGRHRAGLGAYPQSVGSAASAWCCHNTVGVAGLQVAEKGTAPSQNKNGRGTRGGG